MAINPGPTVGASGTTRWLASRPLAAGACSAPGTRGEAEGRGEHARGLVFASNVDALLGLRASSGSTVARAGVPALDFTVSELLALGDQLSAR